MAITNTYIVNGGAASAIIAGFADIEMSNETGVKAGCDKYPIPLLNKITVTSRNGELSKSKTIYAGYKIVEQMLGSLVATGNYNTGTPLLNTIISSGRFGIFEPAHYNTDTRRWSVHGLSAGQINSLINLGKGIKICVRIDYVKSNESPTTAYVRIPGASAKFNKHEDIHVPYYEEVGGRSRLTAGETVSADDVEGATSRSWFESILTKESLNVDLSSSIVNPKTTEDITITLMAYIGDLPTPNNTFPILKMTTGSVTSVTVPFETYEPTIAIFNKDQVYNQDTYADGYGSVAEYNTGSEDDTTISINITPPAE